MAKAKYLQVLERSAERLRNPRNWAKGRFNRRSEYADNGMAHCLIGTIRAETARVQDGLSFGATTVVRDRAVNLVQSAINEMATERALPVPVGTDPISLNDRSDSEFGSRDKHRRAIVRVIERAIEIAKRGK